MLQFFILPHCFQKWLAALCKSAPAEGKDFRKVTYPSTVILVIKAFTFSFISELLRFSFRESFNTEIIQSDKQLYISEGVD